jgi:hypothetical protein
MQLSMKEAHEQMDLSAGSAQCEQVSLFMAVWQRALPRVCIHADAGDGDCLHPYGRMQVSMKEIHEQIDLFPSSARGLYMNRDPIHVSIHELYMIEPLRRGEHSALPAKRLYLRSVCGQ